VPSTQQIGRLTAEPGPLKSTEHGTVTTFRIAVARPKASAREADFFTVEVWQRLAEVCAAHLHRGREVAVEGRLEQREWRSCDDESRERVVIVARNVRFLRGGGRATVNAETEIQEEVPF
jgi:single-strand DNA-binding protein